jgi:hypothetical protein
MQTLPEMYAQASGPVKLFILAMAGLGVLFAYVGLSNLIRKLKYRPKE